MDWISVEDRLPEDNNGWFLVVTKDALGQDVQFAEYFFEQKEETEIFQKHPAYWSVYKPGDCESRPFIVTHWMPLPEPPKDNK